jgi:hypothetical protein
LWWAWEGSNLQRDAAGGVEQNLLPLLNSGRVELLGSRRLVAQLVGLERRVSRGGKDCIDHAPGAHDDLANSAAGALIACMNVSFMRLGAVRPDGSVYWHPGGGLEKSTRVSVSAAA